MYELRLVDIAPIRDSNVGAALDRGRKESEVLRLWKRQSNSVTRKLH